MAEIKLALPTIFLHEGRYSNDAGDPGGATNYGISLRFLMQTGDLNLDGWRDGDINQDGRVNVQDIREMTEEKAAELYELYFWKPNGYGRIESQNIATKIFDLAVNMGSYPANKITQRAVRAVCGLRLSEDGMLGARSFAGIQLCDAKLLIVAIKCEAAGYYRSIKYAGSNNFIN